MADSKVDFALSLMKEPEVGRGAPVDVLGRPARSPQSMGCSC